jgi:hypothetical protein
MKKTLIILMAAVALGFAGCFVPSVNPLYTEKDLVFDPALAGTWGKADEDQRWIFARDGDKSYAWTVQEKDSTNVFRAHLLKLGEHRFFDAILVRTTDEAKGLARICVVMRPAHLFFKVEITNSVLRLDALDCDWLEKLVKEDPHAVTHEWLHEPDNPPGEDGRVLLTASTAELQSFILKHASDPKAFHKSEPMSRREDAASKATAK